jgi:LacI family transcriptional regulator
MVTVRDVARESGFSVGSVSIVLNNAPLARYMSDEAKRRIKEASRKLGYKPNQLARSLRGVRSHSVGVMVFDVTDPFCTLIIRGIENTLYEQSYLSIFADAHNELPRFERYLEMMLERRVEGLIVIANWLVVDINLLADLERHRIPTVIVARQIQRQSVSSILVDNESGGRMAIQHLYELGHRQIAVLRGPKAVEDSGLRWNGIRHFARGTNLKLDSRLIVDLPDSPDANYGFEAAQQLTAELLQRNIPFTALLAYDDVTAIGAMRALTDAGVRVPEQCSVIGFDDVAAASFTSPALTTIRQPMQAMGAAAVQIVSEAIRAASEKREFSSATRLLAPELVVRHSTTAAPRS